MAWLTPAIMIDKRMQLTMQKRVRDAKRWLWSTRTGPAFVIAVLTVVCVLLFFISTTPAHGSGSPRVPPEIYWSVRTVREADLLPDSYPPPEAIEEFIGAATKYIIRANAATKEGRFLYSYEIHLSDDSLRVSRKYNTLRHSGTVYALADSCPPTTKSLPPYCKHSRETLRRAAAWLQRTAAPMGASGALGLWSQPAVERPWRRDLRDSAGEVRAGGIGLGLIALVAGRQAGLSQIDDNFLRDVARGVTDVLQEPDGTVKSFFGNEVDQFRHSAYYAGEAALGLLRLHSVNGNETLLEAAQNALLRLASTTHHVKCDHWTLIATGALFRAPSFDSRSRSSMDGPATRDVLKRHARRVLRACYHRNKVRLDSDRVPANSYGSTVEAQLNVLPLLAEDGGHSDEGGGGIGNVEAREVWCLAKETLGAMMAMQFRDGGEPYGRKLDGAVAGRGNLQSIVRDGQRVRVRSRFNGVFQIDTTQHTLSGMLAYLRVSSHPLFKDISCSFGQALSIPRGVANMPYRTQR